MSATKRKLARRASPTEILSHWPKLIQDFQFSSNDFYCRVEKLLCERQVPQLHASRVDWKEGGPLSARREYLRLERQRLVFDVCAAPFGSGFFVSIWFGTKPIRFVKLSWFLLFLGLLSAIQYFIFSRTSIFYFLRWFGIRPKIQTMNILLQTTNIVLMSIMAMALFVLVLWVGPNLDDFLIQTPIIGYFYERFFRKITFYRIDQMCMYQLVIHSAVTQVIDEITKPLGIQPLSESDRQPTMKGFLQPQGSNGRG